MKTPPSSFSRRDFLKTTLTASGALALTPSLHAQSQPLSLIHI